MVSGNGKEGEVQDTGGEVLETGMSKGRGTKQDCGRV